MSFAGVAKSLSEVVDGFIELKAFQVAHKLSIRDEVETLAAPKPHAKRALAAETSANFVGAPSSLATLNTTQEWALVEQTTKKRVAKGGWAPKALKQVQEKVFSINEALSARNNLSTKTCEVKVDAIYKALNKLLLYGFHTTRTTSHRRCTTQRSILL